MSEADIADCWRVVGEWRSTLFLLIMKEFSKHESMFGWFVRRTSDTLIYVKAVLERQRSFLGYF